VQTILIQLTGGGTYLPTARAVRGGYGAIPKSNRVGPEDEQVLVDRPVEVIRVQTKPVADFRVIVKTVKVYR